MEDATNGNVPMEKLAEAFKPENGAEKKNKAKVEKKSKKKLVSIIVFVFGILTMIAGAVFLIIQLTGGPVIQDGEYLISAKEWILEDGSNCDSSEETESNCEHGVIWKFTEIGKGTLTTNNHINDYDFIWALDDGELKIETDWLYTLENEYEYELNQNDNTLILKDGDKEFKFVGVFETE